MGAGGGRLNYGQKLGSLGTFFFFFIFLSSQGQNLEFYSSRESREIQIPQKTELQDFES